MNKPVFIPPNFKPVGRDSVEPKLMEPKSSQGSTESHPAGNCGLGDRIHAVAGPIGRAIHWPCLKGDGTLDLKPNSLCDRLRQSLNKVKL